jgi:RHS repeat-associated protein
MTEAVVGRTELDYAYDGLGRRASRAAGTSRTDYWFDASGMVLETGAADGTYLRNPDGTLLSTVTGTGFANYGTDRLGSITATTNAGGNLVNTYRYNPWGTLLGSTGTGRNPFRFTGAYLDGATGFYQMGARYYAPGQGRFTQQDPLGSSVFEANRYHYTNCNPTNYTDPTGLFTFSCFTSAAKLVFGIAQFASAGAGAPAWVFNTYSVVNRILDAGGIFGDAAIMFSDGATTDEIINVAQRTALFLFDAALALTGFPDAIKNIGEGIIGVEEGCFGNEMPDANPFQFAP